MIELTEELIGSARVSPRTREVMLDRVDANNEAAFIEGISKDENHRLLRAIIQRLIPQSNTAANIDIAYAIMKRRQDGIGDGWRFATMPSDLVALRCGLAAINESARSLHSFAFSDLRTAQQDQLLHRIQRGDVQWKNIDPKVWFRELISEAIEIYISHPSTLQSIGFDGIAFLPRWETIELGEVQDSNRVAT